MEALGQGAHGIVYRARQPGAGQLVALKVIERGEPSNELEHLVLLKHPNIVRLYDGSGLHHDPPFFAMALMEPRSLADQERQVLYRDPRKAAELIVKLAGAVQCAHEHNVLHRDLKPANILFDARNEPQVSDFGVAKHVDGEELPLTNTVAGSLGYMSPEQAYGLLENPVNAASDVYGLGAILYELLTGEPPHAANDLAELKQAFRAGRVVAPRTLAPHIPRDLERVCLCAIEPERERRYRSADALAADLRRVLECKPPQPPNRPAPRWTDHALCAARRHPWMTASVACGALLLTAINVLSLINVRDQRTELQSVVLGANAALAKAQAQAALAQLEKYASQTALVAANPSLETYLALPATPDRDPELKLAMPDFETAFVLDCDAVVHAQYPRPPADWFKTKFGFRDYFRGAMELAQRGSRAVYVSRAFHSRWDGRFKFGFATPVYGHTGTVAPCFAGSSAIGVFVAARNASSTLGDVQIPELPGSGQRTALFGPRDRETAAEHLPAASVLHVIVHEGLRPGDERRVDRLLASRLSQLFGPAAPPGEQFHASSAQPYKDSDYTDTTDATHARWLGGFFPVGRTGFVVEVQTAYGAATQPIRRSALLLALNLGFFLYCVGALWLSMRKQTAPSAATGQRSP